MKKTLVLLACIVTLAISASAHTQQTNFADLPLIASPAPLPAGYGTMNWGNFWYVDPSLYSGAGAGYQNLFTHRDVAFIGGQFCGPVSPGCYGVISSGSGGPFLLVSAMMAAGYQANQVTVLAYNSGKFVGSVSFNLSTAAQVVNFPAWGAITEVQIQTDEAGDLVLFDLNITRIVQ